MTSPLPAGKADDASVRLESEAAQDQPSEGRIPDPAAAQAPPSDPAVPAPVESRHFGSGPGNADAADAVPPAAVPGAGQPIESRTPPKPARTAPGRPVRGMATLPGVTQRQHRFAALAGGGVTLIAIGGFAALIAFAPTEPRIKDALVPPAPETALAMPPMDGRETSIERPAVAPSPEVDDLANIEDWPVADEPDPRVPLGESDTQAALSADSPRWADSTDGGEAAAEAMSGDDVATEAARPAVDSADASPDGRGAAPAEAVSEEEATDPSTTAAIGRSEDRPGRITQAVNLRSRPADEGKVLRVVPARAAVTVIGCDAWCEVEYEGTRGFVYKRFVR